MCMFGMNLYNLSRAEILMFKRYRGKGLFEFIRVYNNNNDNDNSNDDKYNDDDDDNNNNIHRKSVQ